jgi:DNA-binding MarR family transcriptional regulator
MGSNISSSRNDMRGVLDGVRSIVQSLRESSRFAEKHVGLSGAQLFVLQTLAEARTLSMTALAAATHTHQSSVSTVIARLVERGFVKRVPSPRDGRSVSVSLTARGRTLVNQSPDVAQQRLIRGVQRLPATRRRLLASILDELTEAMNVADPAPAMFFEEHERKKKAAAKATPRRVKTASRTTRTAARA